MPADERQLLAIEIAADEADEQQPSAHDDLLAASRSYIEHRDSPHTGYLISSRLASLHDYVAAERAATAVHDDEWNQRAWTTIAIFQAEEGNFPGARQSIAKIGQGELEHKLDMDAQGRDSARVRVAAALNAQGHPDVALTFLDEQEDKSDIGDSMLAERVAALAMGGDLVRAQALAQSRLAESPIVTEHEEFVAAALIQPWFQKDPAAAEKWIGVQKSPELRAALWIALATAASGVKPPVFHYFVNWD